MKLKINIQLSIIALITIISTVIGITVVYYNLFQDQIKNDLRKNVELLTYIPCFQSTTEPENIGTQFHLNPVPQNKLKTNDLRITWISSQGDILYDSEANFKLLPNHLGRPEVQEAIKNNYGEAIRVSSTLHMNTYYCAKLLPNNTLIRVSTQAPSMMKVFMAVAPIILITCTIVLAAIITLGRLLTSRFLEPITQMVEDLEDGLHILPYPELRPLAETIRLQHEKILSTAKQKLDFTAIVSHELKTPLTAISGYAELVEYNIGSHEQQAAYLRGIRQNVNRLLSLINDVVKLSELDNKEIQQQFSSCDLYELAIECCNSLQFNAEQRKVTLYIDGDKTLVSGNKDLLKELIINLIQNGIQYNKEGGFVKVSVYSKNSRHYLTVEDNGIGIPRKHQERIFERFYRVDKSRSKETGGTGLGLAIVKHIAEIHGAQIELKSEENRGVNISIIF